MAKHDRVAFRYARAIFDLLKGSNGKSGGGKVLDDLRSFSNLVRSNPELKKVLTMPTFNDGQRRAILEDLGTRMKIENLATKILLTLSQSGRLGHLDSVVERVDDYVLQDSEIASLRVKAAEKLSAEEKKKIESKFHKVLGKKVHASYEVDPSLIGGLHITADGRTYDGSLAGWLSSFEEQLVGQI